MPKRPHHPAAQPQRAAGAAFALVVWLASCAAPAPPPGTVAAVTVTPVPAGVLVEWSGGEGAAGFVVYRGAEGEEPAEVARLPGDASRHADYTVLPGTAYSYAVAAVGPGGVGDPVLQDAAPVAPQPGARLTVAVDGPGAVQVEAPFGPVTCREECVVGFAPGAEAVLAAAGDEEPFAGFGDPCPPSPTCRLVVEEDARVVALFRGHVLRLALDGDAPVRVTVSPPDDRGRDTCELRPDADCLLGFTFTPGSVLHVSVNAAPTDPARAGLVGLAGACQADQGFCVADVLGAASVEVLAALTPVAVPDEFQVRADAASAVAAPGVLANDDVGAAARAELVEFAGPGELQLGADGSIAYSPPGKPPKSVTFSYRVRGAHDVAGPVAQVSLAVVAPPKTKADRYTTLEDAELSVPAPGVLANDDAGGGATVELVRADGHGELDLRPDGSFTFRPAQDDARPFGFAYRVRNALGAVSEDTAVNVDVKPVNDPPTFTLADDQVTAERGRLVTVEGFARDVSPGGGPDEAGQGLGFIVTRHSGDRLPFLPQPSISADGTLRFAGFAPGSATFQVVLVDSGGNANGGSPVSEPRYLTITIR